MAPAAVARTGTGNDSGHDPVEEHFFESITRHFCYQFQKQSRLQHLSQLVVQLTEDSGQLLFVHQLAFPTSPIKN